MDEIYRSRKRRMHQGGAVGGKPPAPPRQPKPKADKPVRSRPLPDAEPKAARKAAKTRKPMRGWQKALIALGAVILALILTAAGMYIYYQATGDKTAMVPFLQMYLSCAANNVSYQPTPTPLKPTASPEATAVSGVDESKVTNVLFIGLGGWSDPNSQKTDINIIVSLDKNHNRIKMTSILRDMQVDTPDTGEQKLNAVYSLGGEGFCTSMVNAALGLDIEKYIKVNIRDIEKIVDKLGGVTVTINQDEVDLVNQNIKLANAALGGNVKLLSKAGSQTLSGRQAAAYLSIRKGSESEDERMRRQRSVMGALFAGLKEKSVLDTMPVFESVLSMMQTNMTKEEMISFITDAFMLMDSEVMQYRVPAEGHYTVVDTNIVPKQPETNDLLRDFIYESPAV